MALWYWKHFLILIEISAVVYNYQPPPWACILAALFFLSFFSWVPFSHSLNDFSIRSDCPFLLLAPCGTFFGPQVVGLALSVWISYTKHLSMYFTLMHFTFMEYCTFLYPVFDWLVEILCFCFFRRDLVPLWYCLPVTKLIEWLWWDKFSPSP